MSQAYVGQVAKLTAIVSNHLPGGGGVAVWIRGHMERIAIESIGNVGIGDTLVLEADVIGVSDRAIALKCHGRVLTIDRQFLEF